MPFVTKLDLLLLSLLILITIVIIVVGVWEKMLKSTLIRVLKVKAAVNEITKREQTMVRLSEKMHFCRVSRKLIFGQMVKSADWFSPRRLH